MTPAAQVAAALTLGQQVSQLYSAVARRANPTAPASQPQGGPASPGLGPLNGDEQFRLLLLAVQAQLYRLKGTATDAGLVMPTANDLITEGATLYGDAGCKVIADLHVGVLEVLGAAAPSVGAAYEVGSELAALRQATNQAASALSAAMESGQVDHIRDLLGRLRSILPAHSAQAVTGALNNWEDWLAAGLIGKRKIDWNSDGPTVAAALDKQGQEWLSLLSGTKSAVDMLAIDDYVTAAEGMVGQYRQLGERFLVQWWPWLVGGSALAAAIVVAFLYWGHGDTGGFGAIATLLTAVGITTKAATSTLEKTATDIGNSLWQAELDDAMVLAATSLPAGDQPVVMPVFRPMQRKAKKASEHAQQARHAAIAARALQKAPKQKVPTAPGST